MWYLGAKWSNAKKRHLFSMHTWKHQPPTRDQGNSSLHDCIRGAWFSARQIVLANTARPCRLTERGQGQVGEVKRCSKRTNPGKLTNVPWKSLLGSDAFPIETVRDFLGGRPLVFRPRSIFCYNFSYLLRANSPRILVCIRKSWIAASPFTSKKWCEMISGEQ